MNINMKYYIVTIGAIFIALGVGILVGFNLNYDQALTKQQSEVLESFNKEFENLKSKNKNLQSDLNDVNENIKSLESYINLNIKELVDGELTDKNTGIILTSENHDYSKEIESLIEKAKGTVSFNIVIKDSINDKDKLKELSKETNETFEKEQDVINYIIEALGDQEGYDKLQQLDELGIIKINSIDKKNYQEYDSVVMMGDLTGKDIQKSYNSKDKLLVEKLKENNKYLVSTSQTDKDDSLLSLYLEDNVSVIDNLDEGIGKISLVTLLKNQNIVGSYGRSDLAKELMAYKNN